MEEKLSTEHGPLVIYWDDGREQTTRDMFEWIDKKIDEVFDGNENVAYDLCTYGSFSVLLKGKNKNEGFVDKTGCGVLPFKLAHPKKPFRTRLAYSINYISEIYHVLRKLNFAINKDLKEDFVNDTVVYFLERWEKYEFHPNCIPIAVQKYKSMNIDEYRKSKKNLDIDDLNLNNFLPQSLMSIEGLPLEELEKNDEFKKMKEAITQMDDKCRELLMYVADNRSESEIQKILDIPLGTVSSRKSNCIKKLANLLDL